jgi:general secretion pathway protein E/type IV pilus assembly protein PilB
MGIYELLSTNEQIRDMATNRVSSWEIRRVASKCGMRSLRDDAWVKALAGSTSAEEVLRVTKADPT